VGEIRDKVDMSIYIKNDSSESDVKKIQEGLEALTSSVRRVTYISPQEARANFARENKGESSALSALNEATNEFPGTFRISPVDINKTDELRDFVETNPTLKVQIDPNREPSFAGERRSAIENIGRWVGFAEKSGIIASAVFIAISSLIVFNTIRMAIFNRKDEIQMMKLIGADRSFIRGPFVVEAVVYGCIAAILATAAGMGILLATSDKLLSYGVVVQGTIDFVTIYLGIVLLAMVGLGAIIGVVSALLATRRYLKI
jgi:cell division transport system permease protein